MTTELATHTKKPVFDLNPEVILTMNLEMSGELIAHFEDVLATKRLSPAVYSFYRKLKGDAEAY